jgi:hypothetical protein
MQWIAEVGDRTRSRCAVKKTNEFALRYHEKLSTCLFGKYPPGCRLTIRRMSAPDASRLFAETQINSAIGAAAHLAFLPKEQQERDKSA